MLAMVPGGGRTLAGVRNTQVTDSKIDRIAQIARSDIPRHNPGTKTRGPLDPYVDALPISRPWKTVIRPPNCLLEHDE